MSNHFLDLAKTLLATREVDDGNLHALRQHVWEDGKLSSIEADILFDINDVLTADGKDAGPEWTNCFVDAVLDYVLTTGRVRDYIEQDKADWLVERISRDGLLDTDGELELLVRLLERAVNAPDALKQFAITAIERAVMDGEGPTRRGGHFDPGCITAAEVDYLRRILFAPGSDGPAIISKAEAALLFRIKDATLGQPNDAGWETLFVQGVANHLMAHSDYRALDIDSAARLEAAMTDNKPSLSKFIKKMMTLDVAAGLESIRKGDSQPDPQAREAARAHCAKVTDAEALWLKAALEKDQQLDPLEKALIAFIVAETGKDPFAA